MSKRPTATRKIRSFPMVEDRRAVVVRPRLAFWDWVNDHNQYKLAVRPKGTEGRVYLVPGGRAADGWLDKHWLRVFEDELAVWCRDLSTWPALTREQFDAWFNADLHTVVYDAGPKALRRMHYPPRVVGPATVEHKPT